MKLPILLFAVHQVALVESLREVSGYRGGNVTLPSGADPSWNLAEIVWSIYSNNTWIATHQGTVTNTGHFYRFHGRLRLDASSGDLMIHNLKPEDAMEYNVDLISTQAQDSVNKIKLTVKQRLQKPTVQAVAFASAEGGCLVVLRCSSADEGVNLSWQVNRPDVSVFNTDTSGVHFGLLNNTKSHVEFTCSSSRGEENASSYVTTTCPEEKPQTQPQSPPSSRNSYAALFVVGGFLGGSLTALFIHFRGRLFPSTNQSQSEA